MTFPDWVVLHVPHDSKEVPPSVLGQFIVETGDLNAELVRMTDHKTHEIFAGTKNTAHVVRAPVSRLVVDVERFEDDELEPMAKIGMGAIYTNTCDLRPLRRPLAANERARLLDAYYRPHHENLQATVAACLKLHDRCLIIDCHSFPSVALPYEGQSSDRLRPDICIGTDPFHTDDRLAATFVAAFESTGWRVKINDPFAGALVPTPYFGQDRRVAAIMIEINRGLYLREFNATPLPEFSEIARSIRQCCAAAIRNFTERPSGMRPIQAQRPVLRGSG